MTRFDEVARLRELVGRRAAIIERERGSPNYGILERIEIENDIRNAAPWLLEVAACFQPGDAPKIAGLVGWFKSSDDPEQFDFITVVLERMQKAAEIMEELE